VHRETCLVDEHPVGDAVLVDAGGSAEAGRARADDDDADLHNREDRVSDAGRRPTAADTREFGGQSYTNYLAHSQPRIGSPSATQPPSLSKIGVPSSEGEAARMGGDGSRGRAGRGNMHGGCMGIKQPSLTPS